MAINISDVSTTSVSDGQTISAATENSNNNALKNKINEILDDLNDLVTNDMVGSTGDATLDNFFQDFRRGCFVYRSDGDNIGASLGEIAINKKTRQITSALTDTYTAPDAADWVDVWLLADSAATAPTLSTVDSGTTPGGSANPGTNGRLIGSIQYFDGTTKISKVINYMPGYVDVWSWVEGNGTATVDVAFTHGVTFDNVNIPRGFADPAGAKITNEPEDPNDTVASAHVCSVHTPTTTVCNVRLNQNSGANLASGTFYAFHLRIMGVYS